MHDAAIGVSPTYWQDELFIRHPIECWKTSNIQLLLNSLLQYQATNYNVRYYLPVRRGAKGTIICGGSVTLNYHC